ncbi:hypothetical protein [Undibacterium flavidum]|uniref:Uncharacterized protein n=1 Tax=Undibacterium flavidum TaxID=2762297 RepID=A0ABR6Y8N4_9BURK|nr:hypothetical protein [Undibacterium flavidum]MBC3872973.1 hypothetical protein [Undibacterium flavidum]
MAEIDSVYFYLTMPLQTGGVHVCAVRTEAAVNVYGAHGAPYAMKFRPAQFCLGPKP